MLDQVQKPTRYTGGEMNTQLKPWDSAKLHFAFCFPDTYEVGMSHLGMKILYAAMNQQPDMLCERAFMPWVDMMELMKQENVPLFTLESRSPLSAFDVVGFTLQYEMSYSNILAMLELGGIPLLRENRREEDPIVVAGGPCAFNPEPLADFIDAFMVGDGEEQILDLNRVIMQGREEGASRMTILKRLCAIRGVYVPALYDVQYNADGTIASMKPNCPEAPEKVLKAIIPDLDKAFYPTEIPVPYMEIIHDRIMLEIMRGCTRGCRFCQAGILYRPVRERSLEHLVELAQQLENTTGYEEISLSSLSSGDYTCLAELIRELIRRLDEKHVSISLPSLRLDSVLKDSLEATQKEKKTSLTFAPEAGTQRLRDVINKGVTEENLMKACGAAFRQGWKQVKLYFMMGLPTETDEDVIGIAELAKKVVDLYTEIKGKRGCKVTISVACFVPKPYTPFQWFGQLPIEEFQRRQQLLKEHITDRAITFNYHDARLSVIEGVFARGDRRLAKVLHQAWLDGAKFDGWSDLYRDDVWHEAFRKCGVDMGYYNMRTRNFNEPLPWLVTSPGVNQEFLLREWHHAMNASLTEDCRRGRCTACGICPNLGVHVIDYKKQEDARLEAEQEKAAEKQQTAEPTPAPASDPKGPGRPRTLYAWRAEITKGEELRYVSHLDYANLFLRAFDRAKLPMAYSEGFNPHMKVAFASALSLGVTSASEYMDFELTKPLCQPEIFDRLQKELPPGAKLLKLREIKGKHKALMSEADEAIYKLRVPFAGTEAAAQASIEAYNKAGEAVWHRVTPKKTRDIETKQYMKKPVAFAVADGELRLTMDIVITQSGSVKPLEVLALIVKDFGLAVNPAEALIERQGIFGNGKKLIDLV